MDELWSLNHHSASPAPPIENIFLRHCFRGFHACNAVSYSALASPKSVLVSEALMLAMRVLILSCLLNVSSRYSKALLRFAGLLAVMRASLFKVKACPHSQTDLLACITVLHCRHTFLKRIPVPRSMQSNRQRPVKHK